MIPPPPFPSQALGVRLCVSKRCALCLAVSVEDPILGAQALDTLSVAAPRAVSGAPHAPLDLARALAESLIVDAVEVRCAACNRVGGVERATYAPCAGEGGAGPLLLPIQIRRLQGDAAWGAGDDVSAAAVESCVVAELHGGDAGGASETAEATATATATATAMAMASPRPSAASSSPSSIPQAPPFVNAALTAITEARGVVRIPDALVLPPPEWAAVADASALLRPRSFSLAAVVTHTTIGFGDATFGRDAETSGHYIAYVRADGGGEWKCDP
jgi:hypothetical protein